MKMTFLPLFKSLAGSSFILTEIRGLERLTYALPYPSCCDLQTLWRPQPVHRLDKLTSGLLLVAMTKPAHTDLPRQFVHRSVKKTYCAIVNGIPDELLEHRLSSDQAHQLGVDVTPTGTGEDYWQIMDSPLDDGDSLKSAVIVWRVLKYVLSLGPGLA